MISLEGIEELSKCSTTEQMNDLLNYINRYFSDREFFEAQYENILKLSNYVKRNNLVIGEIESELLLKNDKVSNMFRIINLSGKLVRCSRFFNISSLLEMYCLKNNCEITRDNEVSLYDSKTNDIDLIRLYLNEISSYGYLSQDEENMLCRLSKSGDIDARNRLAEHNLRLVVFVAKNYMNCGVDFGDLIQYGNEGLLVAINKFDENRGYRFTTYATYWIKQAVTRGIAFSSRMIRLPYGLHDIVIKVKKTINDYIMANNGRIPNDTELSEITGYSLERIKVALESMDMNVSLSTPMGREEYDTLEDNIPDGNTDYDSEIDRYYISKYLLNLFDIASLTEREEYVIKARNGYFGRVYSLEEIGKQYGITREAVRQIEKHSLEKLRLAIRVKNTQDFFKRIDNNKQLSKQYFRYDI